RRPARPSPDSKKAQRITRWAFFFPCRLRAVGAGLRQAVRDRKSRGNLVDGLVLDRLGAVDGDLAGLLALGQFALELDVQEPVLERGAGHLDILGELEAQLEGALGDAAVEELTLCA